MNRALSSHWHSQPTTDLLESLQVESTQGLSTQDAEVRLASVGANVLTPRRGKGPLRLLLDQFNQPLIYILLISAATTAFLREWADSSVIFGVVIVNALIGFFQEANALKAINALARTLDIVATVRRDGHKRSLSARDIVPGDIVYLQSGDRVPADMRLLKTRDLRIDEAALTGESVSVEKQVGTLSEATVLADRTNMVYSSTLVSHGSGKGVVVTTGDETEMGRINRLIGDTVPLETPLTQKMGQFSRLLLWIILAFAFLTFCVGIWRGHSMLDMFMAAVALSVGAIPEGLPAAITITLAIGVSRMARRNAIIRKLPAVETLGSTTVICSDKTGTLTQNEMTVLVVHAGEEDFEVTGSGYSPEGVFLHDGKPVSAAHRPALLECLKAGVLCNDARLIEDPSGWRIEGDPTEAALVVAGRKAGLQRSAMGEEHHRLDAIPFGSEHRFMATLHHTADGSGHSVYLKGSLESLIDRCDVALSSDLRPVSLDRDGLHRRAEELAARGLRVLAFARAEMEGHDIEQDALRGGLTFLGLQAMMDPPRPEAASAIASCYRAGISVKMITGDHPVTALAIAQTLGMRNAHVVISGAELQSFTEDDYRDRVDGCDVYARIAPEQKLQLVRALQANGDVVAMTGDGVNDAPALRQADIGVAMGMGGTEVAKEAASMVLTDDHFATIEAAVEEGRGVFDNLVKFITWTLPTNLGEGLVIVAAVLADVALPITPLQILWINMTTAVLLGLMLAFEPGEPGLMDRAPRNPKEPILTNRLIFRVALMGVLLLSGSFGLFQWELSRGASLAVARTVAANVFVFGELFYLFNCRSLQYSMLRVGLFSNLWAVFGVLAMLALQLLFTYWAPMQALFGTAGIGMDQWQFILGVSALIYAVIGAEKMLFRRLAWRH